MTIDFQKIKEYIFSGMLAFGLIWVIFALSVQVYFVVLEVNGNDEEMRRITHELTVRIDGNYSNNPKNIFYKGN
jgi:hypothetical protein